MINIAASSEVLPANGAVGGIIQVANSRNYWPGAKAYLSATGLGGLTLIILQLTDPTHLLVKLHPDEGVASNNMTTKFLETPPDLTAYTTAASAKIDIPAQSIFDFPGGGVIPKLPIYDDPFLSSLIAGVSSTTEAINMTINPATGSAANGAIVSNQANADAHGPFSSFAAALAALPVYINNVVTLTHADGDFTVDQNYFGELSRFRFGAFGNIMYTSVSVLSRLSSGTFAVAAGAAQDGETISLTADPGWSAGLYARQYLRVVSGAGVGAIRPIRSHSAAAITISGRWRSDEEGVPDATSVVDIAQPAARFTITVPNTAPWYGCVYLLGEGRHWDEIWGGGFNPGGALNQTCILQGIEFNSTAGIVLEFRGYNLDLRRVRFEKVNLQFASCTVLYDYFIVDGKSISAMYGGQYQVTVTGTYIRLTDTSSAGIIGGSAGSGMVIWGRPTPSLVMCESLAFDNNVAAGLIVAYPSAQVSSYKYIRGSSNGTFGIMIETGAGFWVNSLASHWTDIIANGPSGSSGAVSIDGVTKSYAQLDAAPNKYTVGVFGSTFGQELWP